jgi:hypothetical protein
MRSAFGVDHGVVSKATEEVPDWASGAIPASTAVAYNNSRKRKLKAAAGNFAYQGVGSAAGSVAGLGLAAVALKSKRMPAFVKSTTRIKVPFRKSPMTMSGDYKEGAAGMGVSGLVGGVAGGWAGQRHLQHVKKDPEYGYKKVTT